jgi:hypothetical protein
VRWLALMVVVVIAEASALAAPCQRDAVASQLRELGGPALDELGDRVRVEIHGTTGSITYVMASGDVIGPRIVRASSCSELAKSLALVIVMSLRTDEPREPASVTQGITIERPTLPVTIEASEPTEANRARRAAKPVEHVEALLGGAGDLSRRPALVLGGRWHHGALSLGLELHVLASQSIDIEAGGSVEVTRTGLEAAPCVHVTYLAVCGLASARMITGEGHELAEAAHIRRTAFAVGGRVELAYAVLHRLSLRVHLDGLQALDRTRFTVDEMAVWTSDSRELWLGAGVLAHFP